MADHQPLRIHLTRTFTLAVPIMVARSAILVMATVDAVMTGWSGARELAYLGLGVAPILTLMLMAIGALQATIVLVAQAAGAGEEGRVGAIWRASMIHALILGLIVVAISSFAEGAYLATGQDPVIAREGAAVSWAFAIGVPGMLFFVCTNFVLEATGRPRIGMVVMIAANTANVGLNGFFVLGWGGLFEPTGAVGAIAVSSALRWAAFLGCLAYLLVAARRDGDTYAILAPTRAWFEQLLGLGGSFGPRFRRIGLPMALLQGVESGAFAAIVFVAGRLGAESLAAHQATTTVATLVYMNAIGMAGATSIRVGNAVGRGSAVDMRLAGWAGVGLAAALAIPFAAVALAVPEAAARIFVDEAVVVAIARDTMWTIGWMFMIDAMMGAMLGALRGVGDVWMPLALQAGAFWVVGVPVGWAFAVPAGMGVAGLWWGMISGILVSLVLLFSRFETVARRPIRRV